MKNERPTAMSAELLKLLSTPEKRARLLAAERRAASFGIPEHETSAAREVAFKRAIELLEWSMRELVKSGRDDAARTIMKAIDAVERGLHE